MLLKNPINLLFLLFFFWFSNVEASFKNYGTMNLRSGILNANVENLESGTMNLSNMKILALENLGKINLHNCKLFNAVTNLGSLIAKDSQFQSDFCANDGITRLSSCELSSLFINDLETTPVIYLSEETIIHNDVVFESGNGEVHKGPSVIIEGEVIGGTLISEE
ncbi:MAG: hypothetical protein S4CHLAM20_10820 [Chlamydiia bacterium]|nr:hypothetical protein [Chlamydiia bacterium]